MIDKIFSTNSEGKVQLYIIIVAILFAVFLTGGFTLYDNSAKDKAANGPNETGNTVTIGGYTCCDSGDGEDCKIIEENNFTYQGDQYSLLKSDIALIEKYGHLLPARPPNDKTPDGRRIFLNISDHDIDYSYVPGCENGKDLVFGGPQGCFGIPNDEIIYVCNSKCEGFSGEGSFDAYFRVKDGEIPSVIKNCLKPKNNITRNTGVKRIITPTKDPVKKSLQLKTFSVSSEESLVVPWLSPYCKPAIYLYPKEKTNVNVKIAPQGKLTLTIPKYPTDGWQVTAYPNGKIDSGNSFYNYLYYEAEIPDSIILKPKTGFVLEHKDLSKLLEKLLPKLGLNKNESSEFSDYWLKVLPKSPYYFIGVVSKNELDKISPLYINPSPDNIIRVTLYFEALDRKVDVNPPSFPVFKRTGFTVVEWGGLFKKDGRHNFTCLM